MQSALCPTRVAAAAAALTLALAGCDDDSPSGAGGEEAEAARAAAAAGGDDALLATVGDRAITTADVERRLQELSPYERARYNSIEHKRRLVENLVRIEVLAQEAEARGYDDHPDVVRATRELMIHRMMNDVLAEEAAIEEVSEDELRAYYEERAGEFDRPEEVRVSAIVTDRRELAEELAETAQGASPREFRNLVDEHSLDAESRDRGGDLGYFPRDAEELPREVVEAAFELAKGEVSGVVEARGGDYFILARTGYREPIARDFDDVRRQVRRDYDSEERERAEDEFLAELRDAAEIEIDGDALAEVEISAGAPAAAGGDRDSGDRDLRGEDDHRGEDDLTPAPPND